MSYVVLSQQQLSAVKKRRKKRIFWMCFAAAIVGIVVLCASWWKRMNKQLAEYAQIQATSRTTFVVNQAVCDVLQSCTYNDFVTAERNTDGEIVALSANMTNVNNLALQTSVATQTKLAQTDNDVQVRLGTVSRIPLFTDCGPILNAKFLPASAVTSELSSEFISAGINQTIHRIYINVRTINRIVVAGHTQEVELNTPILVCECLIVGKVPQTYFNGNLFAQK